MADDGEVSLLITDYRQYYYLPAPPVGFWAAPNHANVLGFTGFLQFFSSHTHNDGQSLPVGCDRAIPANQAATARLAWRHPA
jgi:hypothetical protein